MTWANVEACSKGPIGTQLQLDAEQATHQIAKPYPAFIPTIVYNRVGNLLVFNENEVFIIFNCFIQFSNRFGTHKSSAALFMIFKMFYATKSIHYWLGRIYPPFAIQKKRKHE